MFERALPFMVPSLFLLETLPLPLSPASLGRGRDLELDPSAGSETQSIPVRMQRVHGRSISHCRFALAFTLDGAGL